MRWIWMDKFLELESGRRAVAVKNVVSTEEFMRPLKTYRVDHE